MFIFVSGGVRSGKSKFGEMLANRLESGNKIYIATAYCGDEEMKKRIAKHILDREGKKFTTLECPINVSLANKNINKNDTVLLDCLTNLTTNEFYASPKNDVVQKVTKDVLAVKSSCKNLIVVSNDIFSSDEIYSAETQLFVNILGNIHQNLVSISDVAVECAYGNIIVHKAMAVKIGNESILQKFVL